jgi:tripartite-type tricarboxylate transporter receptor subunit TctC
VIILCSISAAIASAAEYPTKTIQIINPFPPGAVTDIVARIAAPKLSTLLGQQVIIVNKSGGGGAVGIQAARDAAPDGYTILITPPPILLIPLVNKNSGFTMKDFTPLVLATSSPNTTVVKADAPWKTLEDFIAEAKKNPGALTYGSAGPGTTPHFIGELVKLKTKIDLTHVPLGSESAAATAVLGGHVNIAFLTLGTTRSHIEAGTMRALAVASNRRLKDFPQCADHGGERISRVKLENLGGLLCAGEDLRRDRQATRRALLRHAKRSRGYWSNRKGPGAR